MTTFRKIEAKTLDAVYQFYLLVYESRLPQMTTVKSDIVLTLTHEQAQQSLAALSTRIGNAMLHTERCYRSMQLAHENCNEALLLLESAQRVVEAARLEEHVSLAKYYYHRASRQLSDDQSRFELRVNEYFSADSNLRRDLLELPLAMWRVQFTKPADRSEEQPGPQVIKPALLSMDAFKAQLNIETPAASQAPYTVPTFEC